MGNAHKKALVVIFSLILTMVAVAIFFIAGKLQHVGVASVLMVASTILIMDIFWVLRSQDSAETLVN